MLLLHGLLFCLLAFSQETFPVNGVADPRNGTYAFTNATIVKDPQTTLQNATMIIKDGKIVAVGNGIAVPKEAVVVDCKGKFIYPSFIDVYSDYGITTPQRQPGGGFGGFGNTPPQITSNTKGAYGWNQAVKPETNGGALFAVNEQRAKELRGLGFGTVLTHQQDGIARGTGAVVTLATENENLVMLKDKAAAFYSFDKGTSTQDYPGSLMGSIALIRQTYLDAQWYRNKPATEGMNISLQAWNDIQSLPQIFDAGNKWNVFRADKIAKEFGVKYIIKAGGDEYQRMDDIRKLNTTFILPLTFPGAPDVEDPNDARLVTLAEMKHWEMAPTEPAMFEKAGVNFALTANGLQNAADFLTNLRKAIQNGLSESKALEALTRTPANIMGLFDKVGSLDAGKLANFVITSGPVFKDSTTLFQNWVQGKKYELKSEGWADARGLYNLAINTRGTVKNYDVAVRGTADKMVATLQTPGDTTRLPLALNITDKLIRLNWTSRADMGRQNTLSGVMADKSWSGTGFLGNGDVAQWKLTFKSDLPVDSATAANDTSRRGGGFRRNTPPPAATEILYPFNGYGFKTGQGPVQQDILIKNATVWTNEKDGILQNTDVLLKNGKIAAIGKDLPANGAKVIDGTGKHLTAGIIDEHSHIAISGGVNECTQAVTAEVRVGDVLNPEDISIYRHLAGGVTSEHLLHGSCNPIGGQTELIKLRWGSNADQMKFSNWDPFIKFALGENVKRSSSNANNRFPDTRMGVEQVIVDAFQRAQDYQKLGPNKRKDLELETLCEILNHKRFITCHSYVQSEINMLMHVADKFGFKVNTFTHILEGYKVADKMKAHGVIGASTFSDWWAYKMEVQDAIAYNAAIMNKVGLVVAVNSDDAEQARHLNQEAAKTVKYGGLSEEEAFKMCTLNPAIMLHISDRVGSIRTGKDADVVLWNDNPLSIYAKPLYTVVDGAIYFDINRDAEIQQAMNTERARLIQKILADRRNGGARATGGGFRRPMEEDGHYD